MRKRQTVRKLTRLNINRRKLKIERSREMAYFSLQKQSVDGFKRHKDLVKRITLRNGLPFGWLNEISFGRDLGSVNQLTHSFDEIRGFSPNF